MSNLFTLQNNLVIDLFEIKLSDFEGYFLFHGSKNLTKDVVFQGRTYIYIPSEISNLEYNSEGKQNRPSLSIANVNNYISNIIKDRNDFLGKRFYRKKILAKDLDDSNFGGTNKNTLGTNFFTDYISLDTYIIHKKNNESKEKVDFELANILDIDGLTCPTRKIYNNTCQWQYRGCGCNYGKLYGYSGPVMKTKKILFSTLSDVTSNTSLFGTFPTLSAYLVADTGVTFTGTTSTTKNNVTTNWPKLTAWTDQSGTPKTITLGGNPKKYTNTGRLNNKQGILFNTSDSIYIQKDYTSLDTTIFYVSEMVDAINIGGVKQRGLQAKYNDCILGAYAGYDNVVYLDLTTGSAAFYITYGSIPCQLNSPSVYGLVNQLNTANNMFTKNGSLIKINGTQTDGTYPSRSFNNPSINNSSKGQYSEIVLYELIIFEGALTKKQVDAVNNYLCTKYSIPYSSTISYYETKNSIDYFAGAYSQDGNLGMPIADENNKTFISSANPTISKFDTYGLDNMSYKGDYDPNTLYVKGDFVKIDANIDYDFNEPFIQKNNETPSKFFVLISENSSGKNPFNDTINWKEDKCSKTLNGCTLRFGDLGTLPFGSFPGTVSYEYRLPGQ
jgi:lambda family phage minor tail protein L